MRGLSAAAAAERRGQAGATQAVGSPAATRRRPTRATRATTAPGRGPSKSRRRTKRASAKGAAIIGGPSAATGAPRGARLAFAHPKGPSITRPAAGPREAQRAPTSRRRAHPTTPTAPTTPQTKPITTPAPTERTATPTLLLPRFAVEGRPTSSVVATRPATPAPPTGAGTASRDAQGL